MSREEEVCGVWKASKWRVDDGGDGWRERETRVGRNPRKTRPKCKIDDTYDCGGQRRSLRARRRRGWCSGRGNSPTAVSCLSAAGKREKESIRLGALLACERGDLGTCLACAMAAAACRVWPRHQRAKNGKAPSASGKKRKVSGAG